MGQDVLSSTMLVCMHRPVAYLLFMLLSWGGHMLLSSRPAFKARDLKLGLRKMLHIKYSLWGSIDPLDPPSENTPLILLLYTL